ncbi:MAG: trypsin-like peptidase domain-containing protein [Deltaproteobacteria bacterium]|nr:trypsin-like peptidase domain-containing protein [Deltaproteobacteria bacterium]
MLKKIFFAFLASLLIAFSSHGLPVKHGFISKAEAKSLKNVFQQVNPAVVVIVTKESGSSRLKTGKPVIKGGLGSGIVVSNEGLVMTAAHVVQMADEVKVFFLDGSQVTAKVVSSAQQADIALLKLSYVPDNLQVAEFGDSDQVSIGDEVFIVGAPYGVDHTLTVGYLSGRRTSAGVCDQLTPIEFLQTDASINMGNSGGPMFSMDGKLIGIVNHILSQSGGSEGLGFATSINTAKALLLEQKTFWIGLDVYLVSGDLAKALNVPQEAGLLIQRVANESPGHKLGFRPGNIPIKIGRHKLLIGGDIVLEVQGMPISVDIKKTCEIRDTMGGLGNEERIDFKVLRGGKIVNLYSSQ